jgi:hypothetical protein
MMGSSFFLYNRILFLVKKLPVTVADINLLLETNIFHTKL